MLRLSSALPWSQELRKYRKCKGTEKSRETDGRVEEKKSKETVGGSGRVGDSKSKI